ncbi:hypothetical protein FGBNBECL_00194 [Enterococcus phage vB_OCPT_Bob]|uniref:Uncharacterized protein n=1 Tax=Enterococcus phage vB_OCPT_Bob TaxID=2922318 RepID=A0A9E7DUB4_9CAUD|nr:hypothetical protein FGBNBECL_00194 [Enterococcus phage vB_OCPT_Bob]
MGYLESAIEEIERVLLGNKSRDTEEVYLNNAIRYIKKELKKKKVEPTWLNESQTLFLNWFNELYAVGGLTHVTEALGFLESTGGRIKYPEAYSVFSNLSENELIGVYSSFYTGLALEEQGSVLE